MIVKKVQTKKGGAFKAKAVHVRDLCDYIAGPNAGDADEKIEHQGATGLRPRNRWNGSARVYTCRGERI